MEETGLVLKRVLSEFEQMEWTDGHGGTHVQLNFVVEVLTREDRCIRLNADEHDEWKWADEAEVKRLPCSQGLVAVFMNAFASARDSLCDGRSI